MYLGSESLENQIDGMKKFIDRIKDWLCEEIQFNSLV